MQSVEIPVKTTRSRRNPKKANGEKSVTTERDSLEMHVDICALRYQGIQEKMDSIDRRFDKIERDIKEINETTTQSFNEIKHMLSGAKDEKFKTMVTVSGTVIVALIGMMGYLLTHIK